MTQRRISSKVFAFHTQKGNQKKKKKDAEEVFKMPLAKNLSHPLMPDVKSRLPKSCSEWLAQPTGGGSVLRRAEPGCKLPSLQAQLPLP